MGAGIPSLEVREEPWTALAEHARVPISFEVARVLEIEPVGDREEFRLSERALEVPYRKDYDAIEGASPVLLPTQFDLRNWTLLAAYAEGRRIGGAIVARDTPGVVMLEGRRDLAVVWDLRVAADRRRSGVGTALWRAAESWARTHGCTHVQVETQNVNVPACRFYARQGCTLRAVNRSAYPRLPEEIQLLWYRALDDRVPSRRPRTGT